MTILKIALLQILPGGSLEENLRTGVEACRTAKSLGADIALFPEMWSNGYRISGRRRRFLLTADLRTRSSRLRRGPFITFLIERTKSYALKIVLATSC